MSNNIAFPHVTNSTAAINKFEAVVSSNYNAHFVLMGNLANTLGDYGFLSEYIKSVTGLFIEKAGNTIEGGYKTTKFRYDSNEKETFYDVEVQFFNLHYYYMLLELWKRQQHHIRVNVFPSHKLLSLGN